MPALVQTTVFEKILQVNGCAGASTLIFARIKSGVELTQKNTSHVRVVECFWEGSGKRLELYGKWGFATNAFYDECNGLRFKIKDLN